MAFSISVHDLPTIATYEEAERIFDMRPKVSSGDEDTKYLSSKRNNSKLLIRRTKDGVTGYIARLHNTDLITYYPTHYEISMGGWSSISTHAFINKVAPKWLNIEPRRKFIPDNFYTVGLSTYLSYAGTPITYSNSYKFAYETAEPLEPHRHPKHTKYRINRKRLNAVMAPYAEFIAYTHAMSMLTDFTADGVFAGMRKSVEDDFPQTISTLASRPELLTDKSQWYRYYTHLVLRAALVSRQRLSSEAMAIAVKTLLRDEVKAKNQHVLDEVN